MVEGKTKSGYKFKIDEDILQDWNIVKAIADLDSGDESRALRGTVGFVNGVLGDKETEFVEHIRKKHKGKCTTEMIYTEISDMISAVNQLKNSQSSQGS